VAFPVYFVLAEIVARLPRAYFGAITALFGMLLGCYAAMFASWHWYY
jgi:hypothetical protein